MGDLSSCGYMDAPEISTVQTYLRDQKTNDVVEKLVPKHNTHRSLRCLQHKFQSTVYRNLYVW